MYKLFFAVSTLVIITACNSSNDDNGDQTEPVYGLRLPTSINIAAPSDNVAQSALNLSPSSITIASATDPGTDYSTDQVEYNSGNNEIFQLGDINGLLCMIDKLHATELVNQGAYVARVSTNLCSDSTESYSEQIPNEDYIDITIVSQREDNQSPHILKMWYSTDSFAPSGTEITADFLIEFFIFESPSNSNPFGVFSYNYKFMVDAGDFGGTPGVQTAYNLANFRTYLSTDLKPHFELTYLGGSAFSEDIPGQEIIWSIVMELQDSAGDVGQTKSYLYWQTNNSYESAVGADFNSDYLLTSEISNGAETQQCLSLTDTYSRVYKYNLYHAVDGNFRSNAVRAGQRVDLTTSILFKYNGGYGSIGTWGYSAPYGVTIPDQATVVGFDNNQNYTIHISPGELISYGSANSIPIKTVTPSDELFAESNQIALYCYSKCPMGGLTQSAIDAAQSVDDLFHNSGSYSQTPYTYTAVSENHKVILKDNTNNDAIVGFTQVDFSSNSNLAGVNGIFSGTLTLASDTSSARFYWSSGPESYNQQAVLVDSNNQEVILDEHIVFDYTHNAVNDRYNADPLSNPIHGQQFNLYYGGAGILYGFPWYDNELGVSVPASLKDGVGLLNEEGEYLVKATEVSTYSTEKDLSECVGLDAQGVLNSTELSYLAREDMQDLSITTENKPIVIDPPRVIDGVMQ